MLRLHGGAETDDVEGLGAVQLQALGAGAVLELQRQHAHAHQVGAVDALETLSHNDFHAEQVGALGGPIAAGTGAVLLARDHDERGAGGLIGDGRVVDRGLMAIGAEGVATLFAAEHQVLDADVGEGAAGHDAVVAAAAAVAVEVDELDAVVDQEPARRGALLDSTGRGDVVGGHRVPEDAQRTGPADLGNGACLHAELREERRLLDVGGIAVPLVHVAHARGNLVPLRVLGCEVGVERPEHLGLEGGLQGVAHLGQAGPDVLQEHRAVVALADGLGGQVLVDPAGQREGHHQRR